MSFAIVPIIIPKWIIRENGLFEKIPGGWTFADWEISCRQQEATEDMR